MTEQATVHDFVSKETEEDTCEDGTPTSRGTCCEAQAVTTVGAPATAIPLATLGITEPLAVERRP